jgi:midasin (ATPase involved in ribosome maturation)
LDYARTAAPQYGLARALYDGIIRIFDFINQLRSFITFVFLSQIGFCMSFVTQLEGSGEATLRDEVARHVLSNDNNNNNNDGCDAATLQRMARLPTRAHGSGDAAYVFFLHFVVVVVLFCVL